MITVRFGIDDVAQIAAPARDFRFELQRITRLVRTVDHDDAVVRRHEAVIAAADSGFDENVSGELLHAVPPLDSRDPGVRQDPLSHSF